MSASSQWLRPGGHPVNHVPVSHPGPTWIRPHQNLYSRAHTSAREFRRYSLPSRWRFFRFNNYDPHTLCRRSLYQVSHTVFQCQHAVQCRARHVVRGAHPCRRWHRGHCASVHWDGTPGDRTSIANDSVQADKIQTILKAAKITEVEPIWASLFAKV